MNVILKFIHDTVTLCPPYTVFILSRPQEGNATGVSSHSKIASARTVCSLLLCTVIKPTCC